MISITLLTIALFLLPSGASQINKPLKQISSHAATQDHRPKKKPLARYSDEEGDDDAEAFTMLRSMLGYLLKAFFFYSNILLIYL